MPFNGSGVATPPGADFPAVANTLIESAKFNAVINDAYTCISTAITKDGQTTVTANIPFSNFRLTGVGNASAATDAMNLRSVVNGTGVYVGTVGGTANAITLTANPAIAAYAVGQVFRFIVGTTNTGAVTIATSGLTARNLKKRVSGGLVALVANDLIAGNEYAIYDDGTQYVLEGVRTYSHGADIASAGTINLDTATGDCVDVTGTTSITAVTLAEGEERTVRFTGILTFTNGASLVLPGGANITTEAGDFAVLRGYASGVVRCVSFTKASGAAIVASIDNSINDFRLTLTSGTPVTTADVAAATTIYCTPYKGNRIALYDGSNWNVRTSAEFSLALGTLTSGLPYDVFCYDNAGVPALEFLAWTNTTTRATALAYQDGILSKTGALTRRYLGTFYTISTTQTADSKTVGRFLWNYYNRVIRNTQGTFASDRSTTGTSYGEINSEIQNKFIIGVSEDVVTGFVAGTASNSAATNQYTATAVAFDSTSTAEASFETTFGNSGGTANVKMPVSISGQKIGLAVGYHYATLLGKVDGGTGKWSSATSATSAKVYLSLGIIG